MHSCTRLLITKYRNKMVLLKNLLGSPFFVVIFEKKYLFLLSEQHFDYELDQIFTQTEH